MHINCIVNRKIIQLFCTKRKPKMQVCNRDKMPFGQNCACRTALRKSTCLSIAMSLSPTSSVFAAKNFPNKKY